MTIWRHVAWWMNKTTSAHARKYFDGDSSFVNAPQCYAVRTLPVLLILLLCG